MRSITTIFFLVGFLIPSLAQRINQFNRLFNDPNNNSGKWALTFTCTGYGFQNSDAHGFGNLSITTHFLLDNNSEFRMGFAWGGNKDSHNQTDISLLKLVYPKNFESYAGLLGLSRQICISNSRGIYLGFNADYFYASKAFQSEPTKEINVHTITLGAEIASTKFPVSVGANFNYIFAAEAQSILPALADNTLRIWDAYCLIEIPRWKQGNWAKSKMNKVPGKNKTNGLSGTIGIGPCMVFIDQKIATQLSIQDRFMPGAMVSIKFGARFKS